MCPSHFDVQRIIFIVPINAENFFFFLNPSLTFPLSVDGLSFGASRIIAGSIHFSSIHITYMALASAQDPRDCDYTSGINSDAIVNS